jgi:hypothetical protein
MRQGVVKSLTKQLREACKRAEDTGENQWIEVPQSCHRELVIAMDEVFVGDDAVAAQDTAVSDGGANRSAGVASRRKGTAALLMAI